ncbi:MAG: transposase [Deltaproteobacteria bacterium]|nr:transposase [Deltaproteobacteria bacterium]
MCSGCGHKEKRNSKLQSEFKCLECGLEMNAAKNVLAIGLIKLRLA